MLSKVPISPVAQPRVRLTRIHDRSHVFAKALSDVIARLAEISRRKGHLELGQTSFRWAHLVQTSFRTSRLSFGRNYEKKSAWKALKMPASSRRQGTDPMSQALTHG